LDGELKGLKEFPKEERPKALMPFFTFRIMVGHGLLMLQWAFGRCGRDGRGNLYDLPLAAPCGRLVMGPSGFVAVLAGWYTTEVGRQPWTVYGHLLTRIASRPCLLRQWARR
jgi:cytochrome d ubiquinol oxidase subunit I